MSRYIKLVDALRALADTCYLDEIDENMQKLPSIDLADYVPKDFHDKTCEAMAKRHTEEIQRLMPKRGEWIPCSERHPKDGRYYVTRIDYVTNTTFTDILWYEKGIWWNRQYTGDFAVIAWMPLPEPWKGADDE